MGAAFGQSPTEHPVIVYVGCKWARGHEPAAALLRPADYPTSIMCARRNPRKAGEAPQQREQVLHIPPIG
jgi:hypothetical protein